jgi:hypothetical protein
VTSDSVNWVTFMMWAFPSKCFPIELVPCSNGWQRTWWQTINLMPGLQVLWATGPGNPPEVGFLAGGSVQFGVLPGRKPEQLCLGGFVPRTEHKPAVFRPGRIWTVVPTWLFLHLCLQLCIWVLSVSWQDQYVDCSVLPALSPPTFRFAIRLIFVVWLWKRAHFTGN